MASSALTARGRGGREDVRRNDSCEMTEERHRLHDGVFSKKSGKGRGGATVEKEITEISVGGHPPVINGNLRSRGLCAPLMKVSIVDVVNDRVVCAVGESDD